jgi:hypothetical protein
MQTVSGVVDPNGKAVSGSGYRVDKTDTGIYTIMFDTPFNIVPGASVTQIYPWPLDPKSHGGNPLDNCTIAYIANDRVRIVTGDRSGNKQDRAFSFIATAA